LNDGEAICEAAGFAGLGFWPKPIIAALVSLGTAGCEENGLVGNWADEFCP